MAKHAAAAGDGIFKEGSAVLEVERAGLFAVDLYPRQREGAGIEYILLRGGAGVYDQNDIVNDTIPVAVQWDVCRNGNV